MTYVRQVLSTQMAFFAMPLDGSFSYKILNCSICTLVTKFAFFTHATSLVWICRSCKVTEFKRKYAGIMLWSFGLCCLITKRFLALNPTDSRLIHIGWKLIALFGIIFNCIVYYSPILRRGCCSCISQWQTSYASLRMMFDDSK